MNSIATTLLAVVAHKMNNKVLLILVGLFALPAAADDSMCKPAPLSGKYTPYFKRIKGAEWDNSEAVKALVNDIRATCKNGQVLYLADPLGNFTSPNWFHLTAVEVCREADIQTRDRFPGAIAKSGAIELRCPITKLAS